MDVLIILSQEVRPLSLNYYLVYRFYSQSSVWFATEVISKIKWAKKTPKTLNLQTRKRNNKFVTSLVVVKYTFV